MSISYAESMLPRGSLTGKTAIVTGGGTGLGKAMAHEFARLGSNVVIASRKMEVLEETAQEISETYQCSVVPFSLDIRSSDKVQELMDFVIKKFNNIDILVNNAAGNFIVDSLAMSDNAWNSVINIVLNGTWYCSQRAARQMIKQKNGGSILNLATTYATFGGPKTVHSAAAKAGVISMTKSLASEWGKHDIRLNAISPGPILETGAVDALYPDEEKQSEMLKNIPLNRFGTKQEIANLASYLVSDYSKYITGSSFIIDGGRSLSKGM